MALGAPWGHARVDDPHLNPFGTKQDVGDPTSTSIRSWSSATTRTRSPNSATMSVRSPGSTTMDDLDDLSGLRGPKGPRNGFGPHEGLGRWLAYYSSKCDPSTNNWKLYERYGELRGELHPLREKVRLATPSWKPEDIILFQRYKKTSSLPLDKVEAKLVKRTYLVLGDTLYKRSYNGALLHYLYPEEARSLIEEIHKWTYSAHQRAYNMARELSYRGTFGLIWLRSVLIMQGVARCSNNSILDQADLPLTTPSSAW
nr:uncharacterized protein LOC109169460 [Ipomoea batatas]